MNVIAGDATIEQFYSKGLVWNVADFYELTKEHLLTLDGWKERSADRFLKSLADSKKTTFDKVLYALGIRHIGETTAKSIAGHFGNIDAIISATREDLLQVDAIGEVIADSILAYFSDEINCETIQRLKDAGLQFTLETAQQKKSDILAGKTIVISGNFSISRDDMKALIVAHGGKCSGSVSSKTTYLLTGEKAGPEKLKKADSLGVKVISEQEFMRDILHTSPSSEVKAEEAAGTEEEFKDTLF